MTIDEAKMVLCANVIIACDRANFDDSTKKMVEDALDIVVEALSNDQKKEEINQSLLYENERLIKSVQEIREEILEGEDSQNNLFRAWQIIDIIDKHMNWEGE